MTDLRLSEREVEDVLAGRQPDGRADLVPLAGIAAVLHASSEVEPAPPMSPDLRAQIDRGVERPATVRRRRHRPRHLQAVPASPTGLVSYRRPLVSVGAAAALLVGLVLVTSRGALPADVHSAVSDVGSAIGLDLFRGDDAAPADDPSATSSTTTTPTTTTTTAPPSPTTTQPPATTVAPPEAAPSVGEELPWWLSPEVWQHFGFGNWSPGDGWAGDSNGENHERDGDRDGDGDRRGSGRGTGDGRSGTFTPDGGGMNDGTGSPQPTVAPTTMSPTSTATPSTTTSGSSTTSR